VLVEPAVPSLLRRFGARPVIGAGLALLGLPALVLALGPGLPVVLAACFARGAGLGILVVAGTAITAAIVPASRRGEAMGLYGLVVGVPAILGLPLGVWAVARWGYPPVFVAGAAVVLVTLAAVPGLPRHLPADAATTRPAAAADAAATAAPAPSRGNKGLGAPAVAFAAVTLAAGVLATFLPLAVPAHLHGTVALGLLAQSLLTPVTRWLAGRSEARIAPGRLFPPALALCAAGVALLAWTGTPAAVVAGCAVFGLGFGVAQHASLIVMLDLAGPSDYDRASAAWNLAYDGGIGVGAVGFGVLAGALGYPAGFALTGAVLLLALAPLRSIAKDAAR
jgi:predicted MFS family arabinose efflux permease